MKTEPCEFSGRRMVARDPWYGSYVVDVIGTRVVPNGIRIDVQIVSCLVPPSDRAILNQDAIYHRDAYETGSIQNFSPDCVYALSGPVKAQSA